MERVECAVIGGGVIGLAVARALARAGREVLLLEAERTLASHCSARNSEVLHAGLYYPPGSLKAQLCVAGKAQLYAFCAEHAVPHRRIGKLIVATQANELPALARIRERAEQNGVHDLRALDAHEVQALEPELRAVAGLFSPSTGIVDSHAYAQALAHQLRAAGGAVVLGTRVVSGERTAAGLRLRLADGEQLAARIVINAAGAWAPGLADALGTPTAPRAYYAKGHYFVLTGPSPFRHLVYPVPVPGGLGTHVTLDLAGQARFGPDVSWTDRVEYGFDEQRSGAFYTAIRRYYPALREGALAPGYTGVRAKLVPAGEPDSDFVIQDERAHGVPGLVNLYGIESPGLTASLALAEHVCAQL